MGLRTALATSAINFFRRVGRRGGGELAVNLDEHSIDLEMKPPDPEEEAWDPDLYHRGCVFVEDYANPIKVSVDKNEALEDPDQGSVEAEDTNATLIASQRYKEYMRQDLMSQLLNPREQWKLIIFILAGLALVQLLTLGLSAAAAGLL